MLSKVGVDLAAAEMPQVDHRVGQGFERVVQFADTLEAQQQAMELVFPGEEPLDGAKAFLGFYGWVVSASREPLPTSRAREIGWRSEGERIRRRLRAGCLAWPTWLPRSMAAVRRYGESGSRQYGSGRIRDRRAG